MADLTDLQAAQSVKVVGSDSSGAESTPVQSTSNGALHTNLRNNAGTEVGTAIDPVRTDPTGTTTQPVSAASLPLPSGAATSANQTNNLQTAQLVNSSGNAVAVKTLGSTPLAADYGLETNSLMYGLSTAGGGVYVPVKVNPSGTMETSCNQAGTWSSSMQGQLDDVATVPATEGNVATVRITEQRALHTNLRDTSGNALGTEANPIYTNANSELFSPLPSIKLTKRAVLAANATANAQQTVSVRTAMKELHLGGRAACEGYLARYTAATTSMIPNGGFNSAPQVATWTNTSLGSSLVPSWTYATDQFVEGTGSAKLTFTQSDNNNYPEITYTYSTPFDMSGWKKINARARVTVAIGGAQTRTVQVRLTSGTAIRIYAIVGTTTTAPFSTEQWHLIDLDLDTPSATAGTGTFDINNVNSVSLRLQDGGNKAGSIWWDDVKLVGNLEIIEKVYTSGTTTQILFSPVVVFEVGQTVYVSMTNIGATATEFQVSTSGADIT